MGHDLDHLKATLDPLSVVQQFTHQEPRHMIMCPNQAHPQTGSTPPCSMNYTTGVWHCFGCGAKGDLLDFIGYALFGDYNHSTRPHFKELIDQLAGLQIQPMSNAEKYHRLRQGQASPRLALDKSMVLDWTQNLLCEPDLLKYLAKRGIDKTVPRYQLGYTSNDQRLKPSAWHRLVIPYFYRGVFIAAKLRRDPRLDVNDGLPKYISLTGSSYSMPFNADCLNKPQERVYIVESELDALALMELHDQDNVISRTAGGFKVNDAAYLIAARQIIAVLDNDAPGRAQGLTIKTLVHRAKIVKPPSEFKDLGDWLEFMELAYPYWLKV